MTHARTPLFVIWQIKVFAEGDFAPGEHVLTVTCGGGVRVMRHTVTVLRREPDGTHASRQRAMEREAVAAPVRRQLAVRVATRLDVLVWVCLCVCVCLSVCLCLSVCVLVRARARVCVTSGYITAACLSLATPYSDRSLHPIPSSSGCAAEAARSPAHR